MNDNVANGIKHDQGEGSPENTDNGHPRQSDKGLLTTRIPTLNVSERFGVPHL